MAKFQFLPLILTQPFTARLGAGTGAANNLSTEEVGKAVKQVAESRYDLAAVGDKIGGFIVATEGATVDGYTIGTVQGRPGDRVEVTFDGSEAAGTGAIAIGDFVVAGTAVAKGTALSAAPKVRKATNQPGTAVTTADNVVGNINAALAKVADAQAVLASGWKVVSLGSAGSGAVGTTGVIERI